MWTGEQTVRNPGLPTVLVVEDELLIRICAACCLADAGFEVIEAADAEEAIAALEARADVVLVFTDVNMPGQIDGLDLAWEVSRRRPEVAVIVTSGKAIPREDQIPSGGRFLAKPYSPEVLAKIFAQALANGAERCAA
ncbi:response regulator [Phenylobacterium sp. LjRoot225]|uniref:response regulator n=1 Tax=Phenylobacterium sp. LjRoot225 TaxID=3342285 RepID=UPI003ECE0A73